MNKAYIMAIISDIHFGAKDSKQLLFELSKEFICKLEKMPILDAIIITGDLLDHKLSMNSIHAKCFLKFIESIMIMAKKKQCKVRVIKGTESHDNKQLDLLLSIFNTMQEIDFKLITSVCTEELFEGANVLYLPEEYIDDISYYDEYFNNKYNMVFGHGLFTEVSFIGKQQEGEIQHPKAPVFNSTRLLSICDGPIVFGHIHNRQTIRDRIFYVGSFSRWCFGEEENKGFYLCAYSNDNFKLEFIINKLAETYDTVIMEFSNKLTQKIENLFSFLKDKTFDKLRLILNLPEEFENPSLFTNMVNEYFSKETNIKVIINNNSKIIQKKEMKNKLNELMNRYTFIFDKSLPYEEKISKFIKEKTKKNISVERIRYYLYEHLIK